MRKKINILFALLLAVIMAFSYSSAAYADTSSNLTSSNLSSVESSENTSDVSESDDTSVQTTSISDVTEQSSIQSISDDSESTETSVQGTSDDSESTETSVQNTSGESESEDTSVQSTSEDSESEEVSVQTTSDDSESEEVSVQSTATSTSESEETSIGLTSYNGSTDISDAAVDSITISVSGEQVDSVNAYVDFNVTVNFSEDNKDGLNIESGDTITVSWTAPDGVTFTGYTATINLYDESTGTLLGTAEVTETGVTILFNDNVNNLQHVSGSVTFTIKNYGNTTSESGGKGTITSGSVIQTVTINHTTSTGIGAFGSKGGTYYTDGQNKIDWSLWINAEELSDLTGEIVITDTLPDTETFDSFTSFALRNGGSWNWGVYTLDNFNSLVGSFVYDESTNTITITISEDFVTNRLNGTAAVLHFSTTSTAEAGTKVSNTADWIYYENGSTTPSEESHTGSLTVPSTSGTVSGVPEGTLQITKVVNGTTDPIEGITFRIYQVVSSDDKTRVTGWYDGADYAEIVTGSDGIATLSGLEDGYYEIVEVIDTVPNWIATSDIKSVYVTIGGTAGTATTISNSVKTGTITATKKWTQADGTTADTSDHETIYFQLYRNGTALTSDDLPDNQAAIQAVVTESGESTGTVIWKDLPLYDNSGNAYTYTVKEVDANGNEYTPDGYTQSSSDNGLTIINSKDITYSDITATKNWVQNDGTTADTSDHETIYFQLYRDGTALTDDDLTDDQTAIQAVETASGESTATVTWTNLPDTDSAGNEYTYTVKEVDADGNEYTPDGYTQSSSDDGLTITNSKDITYSDITATKNWVQNDGTTADTSDHETIYFQLYRDGTALTDDDLTDDQTAIQAVVTESGESTATVTWTNLPDTDSAGNEYTYTVKEVDADGNEYTPDGYTQSTSDDGLTITNSKDITYSDITATKNWVQNDGTTADTSDHETIYFQLYRDGTALTDDDLTDDQTAIQAVETASGESTATVTWTNLPDTDSAGNEYTYTVKEVDADGNEYTPDGYTQSTSDDGLTITNSKEITYSDITATKNWVQNDGTTADTSDHETIYFQLLPSPTMILQMIRQLFRQL
jgi:hypothetical protein